MTSIYDQDAVDAAADIAAAGAPISFSSFPAGETATSSAVEILGDPDRFLALKLVLVNPVTLLVAAKPLGTFKPQSGKRMLWDGVTYTVKDAEPIAPVGASAAIVWTVTGSA
jgi:hypothetical protein